MLYRKFGKTNESVSTLGFGCMRLPLLGKGDPTNIDEEKSIRLVRYAIDHGVNYIDTAYPYHGKGMAHGGASEPFVGKALQDGYREKVKLATKLPSWLIKTREDMDKYLNEQLQRLQTDHIDFYLVHALDRTNWPKVKEAGVVDFLTQALKDGRIRYAGFSFHDKLELFKEIVDSYDWSFCHIQYHYLDETFQAGTEGLQYAANTLTEKELGLIEQARSIFTAKIKINCTACEYCMTCPNEVNVPACFNAYNDYYMFGKSDLYNWVKPEQRASNCLECGECETHRPQGIAIQEELKNVAALFE